jgi:hypothetical protein
MAHQAARRVFLVGVKNRLMTRELAVSVLPALVNVKNSTSPCTVKVEVS